MTPERLRRRQAGPLTPGSAARLAMISLIAVAAILTIEGVFPWQTNAVKPTTPPNPNRLAVNMTGAPPILYETTPSPRVAVQPPLSTASAGNLQPANGVIVGGVTSPPRVPRAPTRTPAPTLAPTLPPIVGPTLPIATPTPFPTFRPRPTFPWPWPWPRPTFQATPTPLPTPVPVTPAPTLAPTPALTPALTPAPTPAPTLAPTPAPTLAPTPPPATTTPGASLFLATNPPLSSPTP